MRWIYLMMIALAAFTYMNYQVMKQSYGWETYGMEQYQSNLDLARQVRDNIAQSPGAEQVLNDTEDDITRLFAILQAGRTGDTDAQVRGLLEYEQAQLEHMTQGRLTGDSAEQSRIVEHLHAVVDSGNLVIYSSLGELPALVVLPKLLIGIVPYWAGLAIPVLLFGIAFVSDPFTDRRSFERLSPVSASSLLISKLLVVGIFSVFALLIAVLPAFIDATIHNGLGSLAYPTLTLGHQVESGFKVVSGGYMLGQYGMQYLASILFLGGAGFLIARFTNSRGFVLGALAVLSGTALAFSNLVRIVPSSLLRYFPPLYLKPLYALGYPPTAMVARAGIDLPVEATLGLLVGAAVICIVVGMIVTRATRSW